MITSEGAGTIMSDGLLDKVEKDGYQDSVHQGDNIVNDPSAIIDAYERGQKKASGLLDRVEEEVVEEVEDISEPES